MENVAIRNIAPATETLETALSAIMTTGAASASDVRNLARTFILAPYAAGRDNEVINNAKGFFAFLDTLKSKAKAAPGLDDASNAVAIADMVKKVRTVIQYRVGITVDKDGPAITTLSCPFFADDPETGIATVEESNVETNIENFVLPIDAAHGSKWRTESAMIDPFTFKKQDRRTAKTKALATYVAKRDAVNSDGTPKNNAEEIAIAWGKVIKAYAESMVEPTNSGDAWGGLAAMLTAN